MGLGLERSAATKSMLYASNFIRAASLLCRRHSRAGTLSTAFTVQSSAIGEELKRRRRRLIGGGRPHCDR